MNENIKSIFGVLIFITSVVMFPLTLLLIPTAIAGGTYFYSKGYRVNQNE